jgi:hypothetical protein
MAVKFEPVDPAQVMVCAWADDDAIDWDASEVSPDDYKHGKDLKAKAGKEITWFHFRLLTRREDIAVRSRFGPTMREITVDKDIPIAKLEAMALEAARVTVVEIEGVWKSAGEMLPDKYVDAKGEMSRALAYVGEKAMHYSRLTEEEALFSDSGGGAQ